MESRKSPAQDWLLFFSTILNTSISDLRMELKVVEGKIKIKTLDETLAKKIAAVLSNPENIRSNLAYTITTQQSTSSSTQIKKIIYPESCAINQGDGKEIFARIIGKDKLSRIGWPQWRAEDISDAVDPDCKIITAQVDDLETLFQMQLNLLRKVIRNASYADFREAFAADSAEYKQLPERKEAGIVGDYIDKILFKKDGIVYFDYGFLTKCLIAPVIKTRKTIEQTETNIEINEEQLISYLGTVINENYLLHITGDATAATQQAQPICFNRGEPHQVNYRFSLLMDCSASMDTEVPGQSFKKFKSFILKFIKKIVDQAKFNNSTIEITPFEAEVKPTQTFTVKEFSKIESYLDDLKTGSTTALDEAICSRLKAIESNSSPLTDDIIFVWTDGKDTNSGKQDAELAAFAETLQQKSNPPKIYAIGFGTDCDVVKLTKLAKITGTTYIQLEKVEDVDKMDEFLQLDAISKPRRLMHFIQNMHPVEKKFTVIAAEGGISVADQTFTIPGNISVNGTNYAVGKGKPELILVNQAEEKAAVVNPPVVTNTPDLSALISGLTPESQQILYAQLMQVHGKFQSLATQPKVKQITVTAVESFRP